MALVEHITTVDSEYIIYSLNMLLITTESQHIKTIKDTVLIRLWSTTLFE